jgi:hypothetical protein
MAGRPIILVAAPATVFNKFQSVLAERADLLNVEHYDEAVRLLFARSFDLLLLCYVFDDVRPYRLLNFMHEHGLAKMKTMLVRAVPVPLGDKEGDVEDAYRQLGVATFVNLSDDERRNGREALERFADQVVALLEPARGRAASRS